jgi:hypothetical protein
MPGRGAGRNLFSMKIEKALSRATRRRSEIYSALGFFAGHAPTHALNPSTHALLWAAGNKVNFDAQVV